MRVTGALLILLGVVLMFIGMAAPKRYELGWFLIGGAAAAIGIVLAFAS